MRVRSTLEQIQKEYGDDVRVVWKHYVVHPQTARTPALATCAAQKQGKFHEFEAAVWEKGWPGGRMGDISENTMLAIAKELKLDQARFKADMNSDACKSDVDGDQRMLAQLGVRGTPAFFINGRYLSGAQPIDRFKTIIDQELKKANDALKSGVSPEEYYTSIVAKGKKSLQ